jgi:hypothetical protein
MIDNRSLAALYKTGGTAALIAGIVFRRNIGAEVSLFTGVDTIPHSVVDWFGLLQTNPFIGLSFLAFFDLFNYFLEGLVFLALAAVLWQAGKSLAAMALTGGLVGIAVSFGANISMTMLSLSQQYAATTSEAQKTALLAAGQAVLAHNNPLTSFPETGPYMSLLLIALAGLLFSGLLLRSHRATAIVGLIASGCDLAYCLTFVFGPILQTVFLASGGLFWMIWHILIGRILLLHSKEEQ